VINCIYGSGEAKPKISFPFFVGSPHTPRRKKGLRKENFWVLLPRPQGADEARRVRITTQSERTMQYRATTHAERAISQSSVQNRFEQSRAIQHEFKEFRILNLEFGI